MVVDAAVIVEEDIRSSIAFPASASLVVTEVESASLPVMVEPNF